MVWTTRSGQARPPMPWLAKLLERKPAKLAAVAVANKMARTAWKMLVSGAAYDPTRVRPGLAAA